MAVCFDETIIQGDLDMARSVIQHHLAAENSVIRSYLHAEGTRFEESVSLERAAICENLNRAKIVFESHGIMTDLNRKGELLAVSSSFFRSS